MEQNYEKQEKQNGKILGILNSLPNMVGESENFSESPSKFSAMGAPTATRFSGDVYRRRDTSASMVELKKKLPQFKKDPPTQQ